MVPTHTAVKSSGLSSHSTKRVSPVNSSRSRIYTQRTEMLHHSSLGLSEKVWQMDKRAREPGKTGKRVLSVPEKRLAAKYRNATIEVG